MTKWKCEDCGNQVEAPKKPQQCPCGYENIEKVETEEGLIGSLKSFLRR